MPDKDVCLRAADRVQQVLAERRVDQRAERRALRGAVAVVLAAGDAATALRATWHYARWYPGRWVPSRNAGSRAITHPELETELRAVQGYSRKLSRSVFHAMLRFGPKLEREQLILGRLVDIGADLFAWSCAISRAASIVENSGTSQAEITHALRTVQYLGELSRDKIRDRFRKLFSKADHHGYALTKELLSRVPLPAPATK